MKKKWTVVACLAVFVLFLCALSGCGKSEQSGGVPSIQGPTDYTLDEGYARTTINGFTVAGDNVSTYKESGDKRITWSSINNSIGVVAGLEIGTYEVVIVATNGNIQQDCTLTFTLTVKDRFNYVDGWYLISTPEEFNAIHSVKEGDLDKNYKLTNDLDFEGGIALFSNSEPGSPKRALTGVFDGNGYAIKNAKVAKTESGTTWRMGIFGHVNGGTVRNLKFENIIAYDVTSKAAGVAFGCVENNALIENIYFETHLTNPQDGGTAVEHGNSAFIAWCYGGAQVKNVVAVISTAEDVANFRNTALLVGLGANGPVGGKLTDVFVVTDSTSVTKIYCGKLGSGNLEQNNVQKYADMAALEEAQAATIAGWDSFWSFLFA